uniref:Chromophore lyase cpcS/cpeS n=1 Tax=Renouxia sp. TaxID=2485823 RepID=A0A3G3MHI8_9FLOR|nr:hypothetical protein [Renouxia sp.]
MNVHSLINQIEGDWLVQTTTYYLNTYKVKSNNQKITCQQISRNSQQARLLINTVNNSNIPLETYLLEYIFGATGKRLYFCFLYNKSLRKGHIVKYINNNRAIEQYVFFIDYKNNVHIKSKYKNVQILEYLYFVSDNFKTVKSIINKNNQCVAICFSSKIKMN